jgi:hypothetical protein
MKRLLLALTLTVLFACQKEAPVKDKPLVDELLAPIHPPLPCTNCETVECGNPAHCNGVPPGEYCNTREKHCPACWPAQCAAWKP